MRFYRPDSGGRWRRGISAARRVTQRSTASTPPPVHGSRIERAYCVAAFLIGISCTTTINLVGAMPVGELVLLAVCAHAILTVAVSKRLPAPAPAHRLLFLFAACQAVALASYVVSDIWRESTSIDMIRGWLRMIFVLIDIATLALVLGGSGKAFVWLQVGTALSCLQLLLGPPLFNDYWKFGFSLPVTAFVLLLAPRFFGYWGAVTGLASLGILHFHMDFRSLGAECLALGAALSIRLLPRKSRRLLLVVGSLLCIVVAPMAVAKMFETSGSGRANRSNVERSAMIQAAWEGFTSSPLIGQGSWFSKSAVMENFLRIRAEKEEAAGGGMGFADDDFSGTAIHSQILVSLAEGGVFGGTFFFLYGLLIWWALCFALSEAPWHWTLPSRIFIVAGSFFNLWMSPFSGPARISIALTVILISLFWKERAGHQTRPSPNLSTHLSTKLFARP